MALKEILDQKIWDEFVTGLSDYTFLQSWAWGQFQKNLGEKIWRLALVEEDKILGICQTFTVSARRGRFLFVPHGPLFLNDSSTNLSIFVEYLKTLAKNQKCLFIRISPWLEKTPQNVQLFFNLGFRPAPTIMHTEETWLLALEKSQDELLKDMRKTHRNLIRRASKDGVVIEKKESLSNLSDLGYLSNLQILAAKRHHFVPFSKKYLEKEVATLKDHAVLFLGKFQKEVLAAALVIFYGKRAFYYQSGSKQTNIPVNYLLQWEIIQEAKARGCQIYNFWGVSAANQKNDDGLLMFKSGFGGFRKDYLHAQDLPLSKKYYITYFIERIPRFLRAKL